MRRDCFTGTTPPLLLAKAVHNGHADQDDDHHYQGDGGTQPRVIGGPHELHLNEVAQQQALAAAQQTGDDKGGHRGNEHHGHAGEHAGQGEGEGHPAKDREGVGAQILGGLDHLGVDFLQNGEDGQNHERQEVVDHAQHDGPLGVDHLEGADTKQAQKAVDQPPLLQQEHPGVGAQQEVHPHGQHDEHHGHPAHRRTLLGQPVGQGIADEQTDEGGDDGQ